jgi:hypothetical protein
MDGAYSTHEEIRTDYILVGKTAEKRSLGRPKRRREDNIKIDLKATV